MVIPSSRKRACPKGLGSSTLPSSAIITWEYSRNQKRHWVRDMDGDDIFVIKDCAPYRSIHKPEHGYDLFHKDKKIAQAKTVKELKIKVQEIWDRSSVG